MGWFAAWLQRLVQLGLDLMTALIRSILGAPGTALARATSPIVVRAATPEEVIDVRHQVLRAGRPRATAVFDGDTDASTRHWVAMQADRTVGVVSVMQAAWPDAWEGEAPRWQLRGMAVLPGLRGEGVGKKLLDAVHADVAEPMWCNAREAAEGFYAHHGWVGHGERFDVPPIGPHRRMTWSPCPPP